MFYRHQYVLSVSSYKISRIDDILHLFYTSFHFVFLFNLPKNNALNEFYMKRFMNLSKNFVFVNPY